MREIRFLRRECERLRVQCEGIGAYVIDGMPKVKGHNSGPGDGQLAAYCDLMTEYKAKVARLSADCTAVECAIAQIDNLQYREILTALYIRQPQISVNSLPLHVKRSREWCRYMRKRAMKEFEEVYEESRNRESVSQSPV